MRTDPDIAELAACDCGWPAGMATVVSEHRTSEGTVRYLRCGCGQIAVTSMRGLWWPGASST